MGVSLTELDGEPRVVVVCKRFQTQRKAVARRGNRRAFVFARRLGLLLCVSVAIIFPAFCQQRNRDLASQSLEDLMNIQVTSVSKKEQKLSQIASAVFVISAEDIRRSGATNIPDLLRMVPGMDVAQINANTWAVSVRGLNGRFADELLVLVDGRSVYTPTTGGVFWDVLDVPLEDIEQIEVIRGPGASVWGANAVNGVINIITKKASDTQGVLVVAGGGTVDQGFGTLQYGGKAGHAIAFRAFAKYRNEDHFPGLTGQDGGDGWNLGRLGFRADASLSSKDSLAVEGGVYRGREGNPALGVSSITAPLIPVESEVNLSGGSLQGSWRHTYSPQAGTTFQFSYDQYKRNDKLRETRRTFDVAFQHHFAWGSRQDLIWGVEYRYSQSHSNGNFSVSLDPPNVNFTLFSSFVQDEIAIVPDRLFLTAGVKLEHNYYTGFGAMPNLRLAWTPTSRRTFWLAASKTNRTPSEADEAIRASLGGFDGPNGPVALRLTGNPNSKTERTSTFEAGYRTVLNDQFSVDATAFYDQYYNQFTTEPGTPFVEDIPPPTHVVIPLVYQDLMHGEAHGFEAAMHWQILSRWTLSPGYGFEQIHMHLGPSSQDIASLSEAEGSSPVNSAQLRSHLLLTHALFWDASIYFTGRLQGPAIPSYTRVDSQLTWQLGKKSSLRFVGQNLANDRNEEFVDSTGSAATTLIKRSAYVAWTWQF